MCLSLCGCKTELELRNIVKCPNFNIITHVNVSQMECEIPLRISVTFTDVNSVRGVTVILSWKERQNCPRNEMLSGINYEST